MNKTMGIVCLMAVPFFLSGCLKSPELRKAEADQKRVENALIAKYKPACSLKGYEKIPPILVPNPAQVRPQASAFDCDVRNTIGGYKAECRSAGENSLISEARRTQQIIQGQPAAAIDLASESRHKYINDCIVEAVRMNPEDSAAIEGAILNVKKIEAAEQAKPKN